jgi:hypothetical protein
MLHETRSLTGTIRIDYTAASMRHSFVLILLAAGCSEKGAPVDPPMSGGKADISDRVPVLGALALGGEVRGEITEDLEFHGYTLEVRAGAVVELDIPNQGSSRNLDSTLFVYGPASAAGAYGTEAIAYDDDSGWGQHSRLSDLELADGGRYLVVVGTFDGMGRGRYRLTATCESGECGPVSTGQCHPVIADDIRACVVDFMSDPDNWQTTELEAVELCGDAEPVADAYDEVCAGATPPDFCDGTYEEFALEHLPICIFELQGEVLDRTCVLGSVYRDLRRDSEVHITSAGKITSAEGLSQLERDQVVLAVQASSHTDVMTAEEALERVDQNEINQVEVWDSTARRSFTAYEYGVGDNSYGRIFALGTTDTAAKIGDTEIRECTAMWGPEGRACTADEQCAAPARCLGVAAESGRGLCIDPAADDHPAEGSACTADSLCPSDSGLLCAGLTRGDDGLCLPAWMRRRIDVQPRIPVDPSAPTTSIIVMSGLATVDMDVSVDLYISHPESADLRITLTNPAGNEVVVFDGTSRGPDLELPEMPLIGFSGDEQVVGAWTLTVTDETPGPASANATIERWSLLVGSRWD